MFILVCVFTTVFVVHVLSYSYLEKSSDVWGFRARLCRLFVGRPSGEPLGSVRRFVGWSSEGLQTTNPCLKEEGKKNLSENDNRGKSTEGYWTRTVTHKNTLSVLSTGRVIVLGSLLRRTPEYKRTWQTDGVGGVESCRPRERECDSDCGLDSSLIKFVEHGVRFCNKRCGTLRQ